MSAWYRSPEAYADGLSCIAGDMWSFACILFEYAFGTPLFPIKTARQTLLQEHTALYNTHIYFIGDAPTDYLHESSPLSPDKLIDYKLDTHDIQGLDQARELLKASPNISELIHLILLWDPVSRITPTDALAIAQTWDTLESVPRAAHQRPPY